MKTEQTLFYDESKGNQELGVVVERFMRRVLEKHGEGQMFILGRKADKGTELSNAFGKFVVDVWPGAPLMPNHWVVGVIDGVRYADETA